MPPNDCTIPTEVRAAPAVRFGEVLERRLLGAVFQPILDFRSGAISGFEGLIRGPETSPYHLPAALFAAARRHGVEHEFELACREVVAESFLRAGLPGKLFLNVTPGLIHSPAFADDEIFGLLRRLGLAFDRVVLEITEHQPIPNLRHLREALVRFRAVGFDIAIDDLGEGSSSLRLWSELQPEFVKIDMHFVQGITHDALKFQLLRSVQQIAESCGSRVIAEGIETGGEFMIVRDLGIAMGQGYFIARPAPVPPRELPPELQNLVRAPRIAVYPAPARQLTRQTIAHKLLIRVEPVAPATPTHTVFERFERDADLHLIPVVEDGMPVGLIERTRFFDRYARPYWKELYGRKPCRDFMDPAPLLVDKDLTAQELSRTLVDAERRHLAEGFIITDGGRYLGLGTGQDLVREITEMQITAARYANPLTLLPGNVPIDEHISRLLEARARFVVAYCDLDNFKPFNDAYGYLCGDDMIRLCAGILTAACDPHQDFVGHVGGDDFVLLLQSPDWEERCRRIIAEFDRAAAELFRDADRERGGFLSRDRVGNDLLHPLTTLSIGAVAVEPGRLSSHLEVSAAAAEAKKQAKRRTGAALFVERRRLGGQ